MQAEKRTEGRIMTASAAVKTLKELAAIGIVNAHKDTEDLLKCAELIARQEERIAIMLEDEYKETEIRFP